ncbi:AAA family ATPase [Paramagnetospirillum kuznetsovii]|nr:AAA family ATPase [Paramagnetospirillum kuznetsovii]
MPSVINEFRGLMDTRTNWRPSFRRDGMQPTFEAWRTMSRAEMTSYSVKRQMINMLISSTRFNDDARKALVLEAALEEGNAGAHKCIKVAMAIGGNSDLALTWLAFAATTHHPEAIAMLLGHLGEYIAQEKRKWPRLKAIRVMLGWFASSSVTPLYKLDAREHTAGVFRFAEEWQTSVGANGPEHGTPLKAVPAAPEQAKKAVAPSPNIAVMANELAGDTGKAWNFLCSVHLRGSDADPALIRAVLLGEFPWCGDAIDALLGDIELRRSAGRQWIKIRPTLFIGPAGTGKTSFTRRFAELAQLGFSTVNVGGSSDNRSLQGTAKGWGSANPTFVLHAMRSTKSANPLIMLDELDKAAEGTRNGSVHQTLLSMLEPATAKAWTDECLQVPVDLSAVNWIATANDLTPLKGPLLSRLRVVEIGSPTADAFDSVFHGILRDIANELEIEPGDLPDLEPESIEHLRRAFAKGWPIRRLRAAIEGALNSAMPRPRLMN